MPLQMRREKEAPALSIGKDGIVTGGAVNAQADLQRDDKVMNDMISDDVVRWRCRCQRELSLGDGLCR